MSQEIVKNGRETAPSGPFEYQFGHYRVRPDELTVHYRGSLVPLAPKVVKTLIIMLENAGRFVSKDELLESVWDDSIVEEANLSQNIYMLRRQFQATSNSAFIETLPRRGYRFAGQVVKRPIAPAFTRRPLFASLLLVGALVTSIFVAFVFRLGLTDKRVAAAPTPLPPAAAKAYALGWYYWRDWTPTILQQSIHNFELVVHAAPSNPLGYAGEAASYAKLADLYEGSPSGVADALTAEQLSQRAVALDGTSGVARAVRGFVEYDLDGDNRAAAEDLRSAIADQPDLALAHLWYGAVLMWQGDLGSGRAQLERASNLDTTLTSVDYLLALDFYMSRDYKAAIAYGRLAQGDEWLGDVSHLLLAAAHEQDRQYPSAIRDLQALSSSPSDVLAVSSTLAHVYASMGQQSRAEQELKVVERLSERYRQRPLLTALAYSANGRPDEAFAWLSRLPPSDRPLFSHDPRLDVLRRDRRFAQWLHG